MDPLEIKPASIPVIAGMVGDVREVVGKSGSTEKEEYGQKDGHKEEQDTRMREECKGELGIDHLMRPGIPLKRTIRILKFHDLLKVHRKERGD